MMCLQSDHPPVRRVTRQPANTNRTASSQQTKATPQVTQKTKFALCFLCLFDGLRTPSIRRLVRKPRTICQKPLLTFDPSFYAPSSQQALQNIYTRHMGCQCAIKVDPSVQTVLQCLKQHGTSIPPHRLLIHYYGHGCYAPSADGCLFFFSDDRARYKPLKIINLIHSCSCPLAFIFDCPAAAVLSAHLKMQKDTFAFFACAADETLPLSTDAPMDMFSSCLLEPYDTAIWWHMQRHSTVYDQPRMPSDENKEFLYGFLYALLDAIAFESQPSNIYEQFTADPTMASLFRGFVLAQRVMVSFNIHSSALPELNLMAYHSLWNAWDLAIDFCITLPTEQATKMLYNLCIETFESFSSPGIFPILSYFLKTPSLAEIAAQNLLEFIDRSAESTMSAARSNLPNVINSMDKPSETCLLILAKLATCERASQVQSGIQQPQTSFAMSKKVEIVKAGMLNVCLAVAKSSTASYSKLTQVCIDHPIDCAPYSALLLGMLVEKGGRMLALHGFAEKFIPLLDSGKEDCRAAAVYVIGASNDTIAPDAIKKMVNDNSPIVRKQVAHSIGSIMKMTKDKSLTDLLGTLENDPSEAVKKAARAARQNVNAARPPSSATETVIPIIQDLVESVKEPGFAKRYNTNVFELQS
ncbi:hypothetical protein TRFO_12625 [Tritrichomonas foetus]|uniref:Raptor N-terminal CASPase-like domain-containing protein n=1 Tax=Tritrichomonas foetus TaxID=1144522 RepID=A0A1J4L211_9EUKA|nr:hypothetical protein TRFO_12625 [Tritrichomonas foetus]|eukprot:OHT17112.1 hypothetical protein TRFO_12625 [Tritrichomonas foetus]